MILSILSKLFPFLFEQLGFGKTFQNLRVSSPAPVTIVLPSGLIARYKTLNECPVNVLILSIFGYFHIFISFCEYPCVLTISLRTLENIRLQTWEPTSTDFVVFPVKVFLNLIVRSAVPPPETSRQCWWGDHAIALTAALWSQNLRTGYEL